MSDSVIVDLRALRNYLEESCGVAAVAGLRTALGDLIAVEGADDEELCELAEELGILHRFVVQ